MNVLENQHLSAPTVVAAAPWTLTGSGYVFLFRFPKKFVEQQAFLAPYQRDAYRGVVGSVMLVDYRTSPVGPYFELLFIPGLFDLAGKWSFSISKIYVSSHDSVWNGIQNWGIPKELADFTVTALDAKTERIDVSLGNAPFFSVQLKKKFVSFPVSTALFPFRITQTLGNDLVLTEPSARGRASFVGVQNMKIDATYFPDVSTIRPLSVLKIEQFVMNFNVPTFVPFDKI